MRKINLTRLMLIGAIAGVILLFVIGEIAFQYVPQSQSGWDAYFPSEGFTSIMVDPQGQIWAHRQYDGFVIFDGNSWREQTIPNSPLDLSSVYAIAFDHKGRTWIGTPFGIGLLDGDTWTTYTPQNSGLKDRVVQAILEDRQQRIWVGTNRGVEVFDGEGWRVYSQSTAQSPGAGVIDIALDSLGRVWFGLRGGNSSDCQGRGTVRGEKDASGVSMYDGKAWTNYSWKQMGLKGPYSIQAIAIDKQNQIWVGTNGGLHVFDGKLWKTVFEETEPFNRAGSSGDKCIEDIAIDSQGKVWILMGGGRLGIFDGEKWLRLDDRNMSLPDYSKSLAIDLSDRAWIASNFNGLRATSTARPPIVPSGVLNIRYGFILTLGVSFWMLLGLVSVVGSKKQNAAGATSPVEIVSIGIRNSLRYIIFGSGIGLLVAIIGGFLHDLIWLILTAGDLSYSWFNYWPTYGYYAGPIAGALAGFILGLMAHFQGASVPERRVGIVIGTITGALYGIVQVLANSYPGLAHPFIDPEGAWIYMLVISSVQALIGMLLGRLGGFLFLRKASSPPSV